MINLIEYALTRRKLTSDVSDYLDEHLTNPTNPPIDNSLAIEGAAADAKATGDAISALNADLTASNPLSLTYSQGVITTVGVEGTSTTRIRTDYVQPPKTALSVTCADGYKWSYRIYDSSQNFLSSSDWNIGDGTFSITSGQYVRLVVGNTSDTNIVPSEGTNVSLYYSAYTDTTLTQSLKPADAKTVGDIIANLTARIEALEGA